MGDVTSILGREYVTDAGIETDLLFNRGFELPEFAAFPLLETDAGRVGLTAYFEAFVAIAVAAGRPLLLDTPTWRANATWGPKIGYDVSALDRLNREAVEFSRALAASHDDELVGWEVNGCMGPAGDGYRPDSEIGADEFASLHRHQLAAFAAAGLGRASAITMTTPNEAIGVAWAASDVGISAAIGFTVETDGRLPDGTPLAVAIETVDAQARVPYYVVNCAHPDHIVGALDGGAWQSRVGGLRPNASRQSHAELDEAEALDDGDPVELASGIAGLREAFPNAGIVGGCCGTDARHVAAAWGV